MGIILNIETATKNCSVSLAKNGEVLAIKELNNGNYSHAEVLHPFIETIISETEVIREFTTGHPDHLYKWHADPEDRIVEVLENSGWRFQYDNELPIQMRSNIDIKIPKGTIHRLIPGTGDLKIKIYKS